jgi:hypothetical protein
MHHVAWKTKNIAHRFMLLFTLYTGPKPPSPSFMLFEKLYVALAMATKSNIGNSISSFPSLIFVVPKITKDTWA